MQNLEIAYYISSMIMTLTVVIAAITLFWNRKKANEEHKRSKALESLKVLEVFQKEIIPKINEYEIQLEKYKIKENLEEVFLKKNELDTILKNNLTFSDQMLAKRMYKEAIVRADAGGNDVLNHLEHICAFVEHDICDEAILIEPISNLVIDFKERNETLLMLAKLSPTGGEFKNLKNTYTNWKNHHKRKQRKNKINQKRKELMELQLEEFKTK